VVKYSTPARGKDAFAYARAESLFPLPVYHAALSARDGSVPTIEREGGFSMYSGISAYFDLVRLTRLLDRTRGRPEIKVGLIDGPVLIGHPELAAENIREVPGESAGTCARPGSTACKHGTFVAGILSAKRGSPAPAICPGCSLLVRSIFPETRASRSRSVAQASPRPS